MNKENIYIDLSKCTEEQRKSLPQVLKKAGQEIYFLAKNTLLRGKLDTYYPYLVFSRSSSNVWVFSHNKSDKTELTYPDFIKLFEGGEENNGWIKIESEAEKKELVELLKIFVEENTPISTSHAYEFPAHVMKAKELIQKHKQ